MAGEGGSLLERLLEEARQLGSAEAAQQDFAVNLRTTDKDGTHEIEGIPVSKVGAEFLARFGITLGDAGKGEGGKGDGGTGDGKTGGTGQAGGGSVLDYFRGSKPAQGSKPA